MGRGRPRNRRTGLRRVRGTDLYSPRAERRTSHRRRAHRLRHRAVLPRPRSRYGDAAPGFASGARARTDCSAPHVRRHEQTPEALLLDHAVIAGSPASDQIDPYRPLPMTPPNNTLQLTSTSRASRSVVGLQLSLVPLAIQEQRVATWRPANRHVSSRLGVWGNSQLTSIV